MGQLSEIQPRHKEPILYIFGLRHLTLSPCHVRMECQSLHVERLIHYSLYLSLRNAFLDKTYIVRPNIRIDMVLDNPRRDDDLAGRLPNDGVAGVLASLRYLLVGNVIARVALSTQHIVEHHVAFLFVLVRFEEVFPGLLVCVAWVQMFL